MTNDFEPPLLWPRYIEKKWRQRTLAYFQGGEIVTESHQGIVCPDINILVYTIFDLNLLTFIDSFALFPFTDELLDIGTVLCTESGQPIAATIKGARNSTRWVIQAKSWGFAGVGPKMLETLRAVYRHCGVGTPNTLGALGQTLMRKAYKDAYGELWKYYRHKRPPGVACADISEHSSGARRERTSDDQVSYGWEIDEKNGYLANIGRLPTGDCYRVFDSAESGVYLVYFVRCKVVIPQPLALGPFPVRIEGSPLYPTQPGSYEAWLWNDEIALSREQGCLIETYEGYGWCEVTNDLAPFIDLMSQLRDSAPVEIVDFIKQAIVSGIGRFGMTEGKYVLVSGEEKSDTDLPITARGLAYDWWVHHEPEYRPLTMPHWYRFIIMRCRVKLYQLALPFVKSEHLLGLNTDAILVKDCELVHNFPEKNQPVETGEYRRKRITSSTLPTFQKSFKGE